jgi:hypothetical protein
MASNRYLRIRVANADIAGSARLFHWDGHTPVPFLCECDDEECQRHVRLTLGEYDAILDAFVYVTAPGHVIRAGARIRETGRHGLHVVRARSFAVGG